MNPDPRIWVRFFAPLHDNRQHIRDFEKEEEEEEKEEEEKEEEEEEEDKEDQGVPLTEEQTKVLKFEKKMKEGLLFILSEFVVV